MINICILIKQKDTDIIFLPKYSILVLYRRGIPMKKRIVTLTLLALLTSATLFSVSGCSSGQTKSTSEKASVSDEDTKKNNSDTKKSTVKILEGNGISLNNGGTPSKQPPSSGSSSSEEADASGTPETEVQGSTQTSPSEIPDPLTGTEERRDLTTEELDYFSAFVSDSENYGFLRSPTAFPRS